MTEQENGQAVPLAKRRARSKISSERWEQIKTAHASGIGLREIARNMDIPEGTVLARAKREGWTQQIQSAKALTKREDALPLSRQRCKQSQCPCSNAESATLNAWRV